MAKASTTSRGYGADHQAERERWVPKVKAGFVDCHAVDCVEDSRWIAPGGDWDLGHTPDRTAWTGPEHPRCNRAEGGRRGAAVTNAQRGAIRHSRAW
ncbi:hypothetical protein [Winogradskya humida]|uniref:HNH endonuclease n=1 Tax=Winogradskya humida TaxID=113566 RepID=A0ABQ4A744_9ACTN|nr:hypothetical protein [Actinoplanes humidus]GIE26682.1 hypothetical protein Ahu01nite_097840 [Actinoplanes humidus]